MNAYIFLQHYWWFVVSLLGALLVFLLFVQGGNSLLFCLGKTEEQKKMMINSTGRKWEFTFTTLVTFGGAFFASFPLFYSTSFGGAYWLWMIILFSFVLQAVSYEFQSKAGNLLGKNTYRTFLVINGVVGPVLLGGAVPNPRDTKVYEGIDLARREKCDCVLAVGGDLAQAYLNAEYIEDVAKIYTIARSVGTPVELKSL